MKSTKPRQNFYTQIEFQSFHTAWVKSGKAQCEQMFSALAPRADIAQRSRHVRFVPSRDSCIATITCLFDHLVGAAKERLRNSEAERLRGLQVNEQLDFSGLLHG